MIYLDNHSATRPCGPALERHAPYLTDFWAASFAPHKMGQEVAAAIESRYEALYDFIGAAPTDSFILTSSGAEAVNQALWSVFLEKSRKEGKCHFIATALEDAPTMQMLQRLEELGCFVKIAPLNSKGEIDLEELRSMINPKTALVSATLADGLTGVVQPAEEIAKICKEKNVLLHFDANYAVGKLYLSFADLGADYLTFSGDRIHSLKSAGALFVKEKAPLAPLILGGTEQGGFRGGSLDLPSLIALSISAGQSALYFDTMGLEVARLRDLFEKELQAKIPSATPLFTETLRLPNTTAISFSGVHAEALLYRLSRKGVMAAIGGPYMQHIHRLLKASGVDEKTALSTISFSLSRQTTEGEIRRAVQIIEEAVNYHHPLFQGAAYAL